MKIYRRENGWKLSYRENPGPPSDKSEDKTMAANQVPYFVKSHLVRVLRRNRDILRGFNGRTID